MSTTRTDLDSLLAASSPAVRKLNAHLVAGAVLPEPYPVADAYAVAGIKRSGERKRIRQSSAALNKTEQRFHDWHRANFPDRLLFAQAVTLKLCNGCRFTPDFVSFHNNALCAYEVKGFARDDAIVKLKVAAHAFSFISFVLVTWNRAAGVWDMEGVRA